MYNIICFIHSHVLITLTVCVYACVCLHSCCRLSLNGSGGQCLDEAGARVRRWSWSSLSLTPTPLHPVFLSLNKTVGVRVLGKEQVFVSFLAQGQQAKFSVGTCCAQVKVKHCFSYLSGVHHHKHLRFIFSDHIFILQFPEPPFLQYKLCTKLFSLFFNHISAPAFIGLIYHSEFLNLRSPDIF